MYLSTSNLKTEEENNIVLLFACFIYENQNHIPPPNGVINLKCEKVSASDGENLEDLILILNWFSYHL